MKIIRDQDAGAEIVCRGTTFETFNAILDDLRALKPKPRIAVKNPAPPSITAAATHVVRVLFESAAGAKLAVRAGEKIIDLLYEIAKARLVKAPREEHPQSITIYGPDGKRVTRKS